MIVQHPIQPGTGILHTDAVSAFRKVPEKYLLHRIPANVGVSRKSFCIPQQLDGVFRVQVRNFLFQFGVLCTASAAGIRCALPLVVILVDLRQD